MELVLWVYMICLLVGFVFLALSFLLGGIGDTDGGADAGVDGGVDTGADTGADVGTDHGVGGADHHVGGGGDVSGLSPVSPMVLSLFATYFGGFGFLYTIAFPAFPWSVPAVLSILTTAVLSAGTYFLLVRLFVKSQASSVHTIAELEGLMGEVTIAIPKDGAGVVDYVARGARVSSSARAAMPIPRGATVRIMKVINNVLTVEKVDVSKLEKEETGRERDND